MKDSELKMLVLLGGTRVVSGIEIVETMRE